MSYESMANFLIHKMKRVEVSEKADPNKWPTTNSWGNQASTYPSLVNPYVPKTNQNNWPGNSFGTFTPQQSTGIVAEEDVKKKQATKKYRSIDDPWEESGS